MFTAGDARKTARVPDGSTDQVFVYVREQNERAARHGSGTDIADGPPALGTEPLSFLAALHGFAREEMYEGVAVTSSNPIVAPLVEMVSALYYESRLPATGATQRRARRHLPSH